MTEAKKTRAPDDNDRLIAGTLPEDPAEGTICVSRGPRILTVQQLLVGSHQRANSPKKTGVITTGNWKIDRHTGGIQPGHGWIVAAETSWGKSAFVLALADENLKLGKTVLIISTEDDESIYGDRLLARRAGVELTRIRDHLLDNEDQRRITDVIAKAEKTPIYVDGRDVREDELCKQINLMVPEYQVGLVVVDYLQTVPACQRYQDERVRFRETAQRITHTCKALKVPLIICSQITPDDSDKMPGKYKVRESKDVVNAAEVVVMGFELQRDWVDPKDKNHTIAAGTKCVNIDKVKAGRKGVVALKWDDMRATFEPEYQIDRQHEYLDEFRDDYPSELGPIDSASSAWDEVPRAGY